MEFQSTRPVRGATRMLESAKGAYDEFQSTRPVRGATSSPQRGGIAHRNFNPRAPCGARRSTLDFSLFNP